RIDARRGRRLAGLEHAGCEHVAALVARLEHAARGRAGQRAAERELAGSLGARVIARPTARRRAVLEHAGALHDAVRGLDHDLDALPAAEVLLAALARLVPHRPRADALAARVHALRLRLAGR